MRNTILIGDNRETLRTLPDQSVHCCVTSPPYWGLRSYLPDGHPDKDLEIGLQKTPEEFVFDMVNVFREVRRVLRDDGTVWMNLGDSYNSSDKWGGQSGSKHSAATAGHYAKRNKQQPVECGGCGETDREKRCVGCFHNFGTHSTKPKDLIGIPWRVAFALQADGWYLRQEIIWHKPAPMPESVRDRCTKAHEHIFLLAKQPRYYYDAEAVKEEGVLEAGTKRNMIPNPDRNEGSDRRGVVVDGTRNKRSVWTVNTQSFSGAHFATYPPALIEPCILAGTSAKGACPACGAPWVRIVEREQLKRDRPNRFTKRSGEPGTGGAMPNDCAGVAVETIGWQPSCNCNAGDPIPCVVLDPFGGAGTTAIVAEGHGRDWILCELNPEYANDIAWPRIRQGWSPVTGKAKTPVADGQKSLF